MHNVIAKACRDCREPSTSSHCRGCSDWVCSDCVTYSAPTYDPPAGDYFCASCLEGDEEETTLCVKITRQGRSCLFSVVDCGLDMISEDIFCDMTPGESLEIEFVEISKKEYEQVTEFQGW